MLQPRDDLLKVHVAPKLIVSGLQFIVHTEVAHEQTKRLLLLYQVQALQARGDGRRGLSSLDGELDDRRIGADGLVDLVLVELQVDADGDLLQGAEGDAWIRAAGGWRVVSQKKPQRSSGDSDDERDGDDEDHASDDTTNRISHIASCRRCFEAIVVS